MEGLIFGILRYIHRFMGHRILQLAKATRGEQTARTTMILILLPLPLPLLLLLLSNATATTTVTATSISTASVLHQKIGTLRSNDADGSEKVKKKTIGFISKTTTLHVHHAFLYISLPVFARL